MPKKNMRNDTIPGFSYIKTVQAVSEFQLQKNGLRVLHMYIPGSGTVTSNIVYLVGSRHEERGRTGLAHMLEHMLFKPTHDGFGKKIKIPGHKILEDAGATMNATTWLDRTNYFFTVPRAYLPQALTVEAGRMRNLLIEDSEFLPERANVLSEYEMHAGIPLDALMTALTQAAYVSHGYSHDTIGHKPDLEAMTTQSLKQFYDTYYWPNNAVLTIVGDITRDDALHATSEAFGAISRSPHHIPDEHIIEPTQEGERQVEVVRTNPINLHATSYKVPGGRTFEWAVLHVIAAYLSDGPQSRFEKVLVDTHQASSVDCSITPTFDDELFTIYAQITATASHTEVEHIINTELMTLMKKTISPKRLETLKTTIRAEEIFGRDGSSSITSNLTECIALGDWTRYYTFSEDIARVTPQDIQNVARTYFTRERRTIGNFISH